MTIQDLIEELERLRTEHGGEIPIYVYGSYGTVEIDSAVYCIDEDAKRPIILVS